MAKPGVSPILLSAVLLGSWLDVSLPAGAQDTPRARSAVKGSPQEIGAFLRRRAGCSRLSGEDGDDPGRVAETVKARFWMKCGTIEEDERRLRARYADTPGAIDRLDQAGDFDNSED